MKNMKRDNTSILQGIGTDIIELERIKEAIRRHGNRFVDRLFTTKEKNYCTQFQDPIPRFAGRFAAKEAVFKALGRAIPWQEIEILNDASGKPIVHFSSKLRTIFPRATLFLSISHCKTFATATAILIDKENYGT